MKSSLAVVLQAVIALVGAGVLAFLLWEPHLEGRNAHASTFAIYFKDPFLAYVYGGSIPFFIALHRAFRLVGHVRQTGAFSSGTVAALRVIQRCALAVIGFAAGGVAIITLFGDKDDRPAGFFLSLLVILAASVTAITTAKLARSLETTLAQSGNTPR